MNNHQNQHIGKPQKEGTYRKIIFSRLDFETIWKICIFILFFSNATITFAAPPQILPVINSTLIINHAKPPVQPTKISIQNNTETHHSRTCNKNSTNKQCITKKNAVILH